MEINRTSGLILHPTALPSNYGIGDFGSSAYEFVDKLSKSKTQIWQVLPLGITDEIEYSPYSSKSSILGNPYLISLEKFEDRIDDISSLEYLKKLSNKEVEYKKVYKKKYIIFKELSQNVDINDSKIVKFLNNKLVKQHLVFVTLSDVFRKSWVDWEKGYQSYTENLFNHVLEEFEKELKFNIFTQYHFYSQ